MSYVYWPYVITGHDIDAGVPYEAWNGNLIYLYG